MSKQYERPALRVFEVAAEERVANSCKPHYNHANGPEKDCTQSHEAWGLDDCWHKGGPYAES